jgi:parallel beta-helix repeat protein
MARSVALLLVLVFFSASCVITYLPVQAEAGTIIVPDDYPTIEKAVEKASAGDTVFVRKGTCDVDESDPIVIDKPLSLIGEDLDSTVINQLPFRYGGATIQVAASNVTISGFTITNYNVAIVLRNWVSVQKHNSYISNCKIVNNKIGNGQYGIWVETGDSFVIKNNYLYNNSHAAIMLYPSSRNGVISENNIMANRGHPSNDEAIQLWGAENTTIANNNFSTNTCAVGLNFCSPTYIYGNNITGNQYGIQFDYGCKNATVTGNNLVGNDVGVWLPVFQLGGLTAGPRNVFYRNNIIGNSQQVLVEKPIDDKVVNEIVAWDNGKQGNYWSDYLKEYPNASEIGTSGIGDTPYVIDANNTDYYPLIALAPSNIDFTAPAISILSPENRTYDMSSIPLDFTVNEVVSQITYSLDGEENITIAGNMTLTGLANGDHNVTIYSEDEVGNVGTSETVHFSVNVPFPTALVIAASAVSLAAIVVALLVYFKKRKH